jgi:Kelch motif protein
MRHLWIGLIVTLLGCEFPRPADVLTGDGGNPGDDAGSGSGGDGGGSGDGGTTPTLGTFATVSGVTLTTKRSFHGHAILNGRLTVFSGISDAAIPTTIEQAKINADDSLADFSTSTNQMIDGGTGIGIAVVGTALYAVGGEVGNGDTTTEFQRATINASGTLGTFSVPTQTLSQSRTGEGMLVTNAFVYAIGGVHIQPGSTTHLASIERASYTGSTLNSFQNVSGVSLAVPSSQYASVVVKNFIYVIGGTSTGNNEIDNVQRATINTDGTITTFTDTSNHLVTPRLSTTAVVFDSAVYVIGGRGSGDGIDTVERATINADGTLGPFTVLTNVKLATGRYGHTADVVGNSIYVVGGQSDIVTTLTTVERAKLQ